jgi:outer membrane protein
MRKSFVLIFTILVFSILVFSEVKIGVINAQEILSKTNIGKEVQKKLENLQNSRRKKVETLQNEIKNLQKDLTSPALNTEAREKKTRELEDKRLEYNRLLQDIQKELKNESQKEMMELYKKIMPIIKEVGVAQKFTLILDMTSSGIAYFDEAIDITNEVIKAVNAKTPASTK